MMDEGRFIDDDAPIPYSLVVEEIADEKITPALERQAMCMFGPVVNDVRAELKRALDKHGFKRTPLDPRNDPRDSFITLSEEVGEVAQTFTYDKQDPNTMSERDKELIQVAAMAIAMVIAGRMR